MNSDIKAFLYGWGILIGFLVIRYFYRVSQEKKKNKENNKPQILYFKSNQGAYEFALVSLMNGFGSMNFFHTGIIKGKPFGKKKEVQKKIKGDVETVTNEISKYKIKVAYKGKEIEVVATRTDDLSAEKKPAYKVGDLVVVTDLSQKLKDKVFGKTRDESLDYNFMIMSKIKPIYNVKKMDFDR